MDYLTLEIVVKLLVSVGVLVITAIAARSYKRAVERYFSAAHSLLIESFQRYGSLAIWTFGILLALSQLPYINSWAFVALLALAGALFIVATRTLTSGLIAQNLYAAYNPFKIGDWIQVGEHYGRVVHINPIHTTLVTPDNELVTIPNAVFLEKVVVNYSTPEGTRLSIPISIDSSIDVGELEKRLIKVGEEFRSELLEGSKVEVRVRALEKDYTTVELLLRLANPAKRGYIASEVKKRVWAEIADLKRRKASE